jgi:transcriptional regulator with XRE-family HTH domain
VKKTSFTPIPHTLAERVRFLRVQMGKSRLSVALEAGVGDGWLGQVERGIIKHPGPDKLVRLAPALGTSPEDLYNAAGYMPAAQIPQEVLEFALRLASMTPGKRKKIIRTLAFLMQPEEEPKRDPWVS